MQYLTLLLAIVLGAVIVGGTAIYFLRARFRETVESAPSTLASGSAPLAVADEVKAIGSQIEQAMTEQRMQGETQRQLLAQKLDSVRQSIEAQRTHVDGLRSEMRHESRRRDHELDEIRTQIGTLQSTVALPPADRLALPASAPQAEAPDALAPAPSERADSVVEASPAAPDMGAFETVSFADAIPSAPASFEPTSAQPPSAEPADSEFESFERGFEPSVPEPEPADPFGEITFGDSTSPPVPSPFPSETPAPESDTFESWSPAPPAASPDAPLFVETTFQAIDSAPVPPAVNAPVFEESAFEEATFGDTFTETSFAEAAPPSAPVTESPTPASPSPALAFVPDEPSFDNVPMPTLRSVETPPFVETQVAGAPSAFEPTTFEPATFAAASAPAALTEPAIDPSWIARPHRPESDSADDDVPEAASADEFFSLPETHPEPTLPASVEPSGLIDMDALSAPSLTPPPALPVPSAPGPEAHPPRSAAEAGHVAQAPAVEHAAPGVPPAIEASEPRPFVAPEGADDLTVITSIDADLQRLLYLEGVTTLEEIAQWGRTRARQIAVAVEISEETIMTQWVFEAQAAMFNQFSGQG